jgi:NDP-sugar pyrophosphorylase family protein
MNAPLAVILAAGESSRFWPLSTHGHKSLHRLVGHSIIEHTVRSLANVGVGEFLIVQSPLREAATFAHRTVAAELGSGAPLGVRLSYYDLPQARGSGDALLAVADQLPEQFLLVNPENINAGDLLKSLLEQPEPDATVIAVGQERQDTEHFGVFEFEDDRIVGITEKPPRGSEPSKLCNMGVYYMRRGFVEALRKRPYHEFSLVLELSEQAAQGNVAVVTTTEPFFPLKFPWHLFAMRDALCGGENYVGENVSLHETATIGKNCCIERDVSVGAGVQLEDCIIGAGCVVESSLTSSILGAGVTIQSDVTIATQNQDASSVTPIVKGQPVSSDRQQLGAVIGQGASILSGAMLPAGVLLGAECRIFHGSASPSRVEDREHVQA